MTVLLEGLELQVHSQGSGWPSVSQQSAEELDRPPSGAVPGGWRALLLLVIVMVCGDILQSKLKAGSLGSHAWSAKQEPGCLRPGAHLLSLLTAAFANGLWFSCPLSP